jgi:hypothetical protein
MSVAVPLLAKRVAGNAPGVRVDKPTYLRRLLYDRDAPRSRLGGGLISRPSLQVSRPGLAGIEDRERRGALARHDYQDHGAEGRH